MKEAYVSFEVAKLLKKKGFCEDNVYCYYQGDYKNDSTDVWSGECKFNWNIYDDSYSAPTQQMAMRWLREYKGLHIEIGYSCSTKCCYYRFGILNKSAAWLLKPHIKTFDTYEDAVEAALKYCLTNLI